MLPLNSCWGNNEDSLIFRLAEVSFSLCGGGVYRLILLAHSFCVEYYLHINTCTQLLGGNWIERERDLRSLNYLWLLARSCDLSKIFLSTIARQDKRLGLTEISYLRIINRIISYKLFPYINPSFWLRIKSTRDIFFIIFLRQR